jgi:hypothetical protein
MGIFELLVLTEEIKDLILRRATTDEIQAMALHQGMVSMRQDGWLKICLGLTTFEEVSRQTPQESKEQIAEEMERVVKDTLARVAAAKEQKLGLETGFEPKPKESEKEKVTVGVSQPSPPQSNWDGEEAIQSFKVGDAKEPEEQ